jgi:hypothetical protein
MRLLVAVPHNGNELGLSIRDKAREQSPLLPPLLRTTASPRYYEQLISCQSFPDS